MSTLDLQFDPDEIGPWSEIKLEIIRKYASAYSKILTSQGFFRHHYVDAFAGAGLHITKGDRREIPGSPIIALNTHPPFHGYHFVDMNAAKLEYLQEQTTNDERTSYYAGDCNTVLLEKIFPGILADRYARCLCLLDPYGLQLDWQVIECAGRSEKIEIFLNFPTADMNRNVFWKNPEEIFATPKLVAAEIMADIFNKYRNQ